MKQFQLIALVLAYLILSAEALGPKIQDDNFNQQKTSQHSSSKSSSREDAISQNEDDSNRINVAEPYKSILKTTTRFALSQTKLSHVNLETAMTMLNDVGYVLAKPSNLLKAIKIVTVTMATFLTATIFFPGAHRFLEKVWNDPLNTFNLDSERSVVDDTLSRFGIQDSSCRQRSVCYTGEAIRCLFPETSEDISKFFKENFSNSGFKNHTYVSAFISGFSDKNCANVSPEAGDTSCLGSLINSLVLPRHVNGPKGNKHQTLQAARSFY